MKILHNPNIGSFIDLKGDDWLAKQRIAGKVVRELLAKYKQLVKDKTQLSLIELNALGEQFILDNNCTPTFKNYNSGHKIPFPNGVCISVNEQLVHGIATDYILQEGDLVSFDLGATFEGAIADAAITVIYGEPKEPWYADLIQTAEDCLNDGLNAIKVGSRVGCIGEAIYKTAANKGYSVITEMGGHGLTWNKPHASPFIHNKSTKDEGIVIQPRLTIAIEPLLTKGDPKTSLLKDGWTHATKNISAHVEHTVFIHEDRIEIIT